MDFIKTLLISCIPAIITGAVTYLVAYKNATAQIKVIEEQNKHDLDKLMEQHKVDIDSLNKKHQQELEKMEVEHKHKLELIAKENENNLSQNLMTGLVDEIMKMPEAKAEIAKGIRRSSNKKGGKR
jgi:CHASE3 domain sensor protein